MYICEHVHTKTSKYGLKNDVYMHVLHLLCVLSIPYEF